MQAEKQEPFDEQAALEELDRLRQSIERFRRQRTEVLEEFDRFTSSFARSRAEEPVRDSGRTEVPVSIGPVETAPAGSAGVSLFQKREPAATSDLDHPQDGFASDAALPPPEHPLIAPGVIPRAGKQSGPVSRPLRSRFLVIPGAIAILVVLIVVINRSVRPAPSDQGVPAVETSSPAARVPDPNTPVTPAVPSALPGSVEAGGVQVELTTLRKVWVRVVTDGARAIERELEADVRIPLRAERTIAIRAGNAGSVRLVVDGRPRGLMGEEGEAVTRTFTAAKR
jgi:hypothetical protein